MPFRMEVGRGHSRRRERADNEGEEVGWDKWYIIFIVN